MCGTMNDLMKGCTDSTDKLDEVIQVPGWMVFQYIVDFEGVSLWCPGVMSAAMRVGYTESSHGITPIFLEYHLASRQFSTA